MGRSPELECCQLQAAPLQVAPLREASAWVLRWLQPARGNGLLLDFAGGRGPWVTAARALRYQVTVADRDPQALAEAAERGAQIVRCDLERAPWPFTEQRFEVIVMTRYLYRERLPLLLELLDAGGCFIAETFARGQEAWGRPRNPAFLLEPDELFNLCRCAGLRVIAFEQGAVAGPRMIQRICAVRPPYDVLAWPLDGSCGAAPAAATP